MKKVIYMQRPALKNIAIFFSFLLIICIISFVVVDYSLKDSKNVHIMIDNLTNEQLLLEQIKSTVHKLHYEEKDDYNKEILQKAITQFDKTLVELSNETTIIFAGTNNKQSQEDISKIKSLWSLLKRDLNEIKNSDSIDLSSVITINSRSESVLRQIDSTLNNYVEIGDELFNGKKVKSVVIILFIISFVVVIIFAVRILATISRSERRYRRIVEHFPIGIVLYKGDKIKYVNEFTIKALRFKNINDVIGKSVYDYIHPTSIELAAERIRLAQEDKEITKLAEQVWVRSDGSKIDVNVMSIPFDIMGDKVNLTIFNDISELKRQEDERAAKHRELNNIRAALDNSRIVEIVNNKGDILYANEKSSEINKCEIDDLIGKTYKVMDSGYHSREYLLQIWKEVNDGYVWEGQLNNMAKDGSTYWTNTLIIPLINNDGVPYEFLIVRQDITTEKKLEQELQLLSTLDEVTNLPKRTFFKDDLKKSIETDQLVGIIYIGLDRFKYINDSLGHATGDQVLTEVGRRLQKVVPNAKSITRQGGDEFTILVDNIDRNYLTNLSNEIIEEIKKPYLVSGKEVLLTCRIGLSVYPTDGSSSDQLLKRAFFAMEYAKSQSKERYSFYDHSMESVISRILIIENDIRRAVENNEFELYYQPKVSLKTNKIIGNEALIRWTHDKLGPISPVEFIPIAEETGLINDIGEWVIREACRQNKKWHEAGFKDLHIAVNISAHQFKDRQLGTTIKKILEATGMEAKFLELEITESISMFPEQETLNQLTELKSLGVKLALDDFGTGYSSLRYLQDFPIDTLKIDRSFISENNNNKIRSKLMTNAIISLAKALKMTIVAEGIESEEQITYLEKQDCHIGQGYFISKPLPALELEELIRSRN